MIGGLGPSRRQHAGLGVRGSSPVVAVTHLAVVLRRADAAADRQRLLAAEDGGAAVAYR